jgi:hypothetical protein
VGSRSIPVWEKFWVERDGEAELFSTSVEEVSSHPHVVSLVDALAWTDLELPLSWHDLSVGSGNSDTSVEAAFVMSIVEVSAKSNVSTN